MFRQIAAKENARTCLNITSHKSQHHKHAKPQFFKTYRSDFEGKREREG